MAEYKASTINAVGNVDSVISYHDSALGEMSIFYTTESAARIHRLGILASPCSVKLFALHRTSRRTKQVEVLFKT